MILKPEDLKLTEVNLTLPPINPVNESSSNIFSLTSARSLDRESDTPKVTQSLSLDRSKKHIDNSYGFLSSFRNSKHL